MACSLAGQVDSVTQGPVSTVCHPRFRSGRMVQGHSEAHSLEVARGLERTLTTWTRQQHATLGPWELLAPRTWESAG